MFCEPPAVVATWITDEVHGSVGVAQIAIDPGAGPKLVPYSEIRTDDWFGGIADGQMPAIIGVASSTWTAFCRPPFGAGSPFQVRLNVCCPGVAPGLATKVTSNSEPFVFEIWAETWPHT